MFSKVNQNQHRVYADGQQPACPHWEFTDSSINHPGSFSHLASSKRTRDDIDECKAVGPCSGKKPAQEEERPPSRKERYWARIEKRDKTPKSKNIKGKGKGKHFLQALLSKAAWFVFWQAILHTACWKVSCISKRHSAKGWLQLQEQLLQNRIAGHSSILHMGVLQDSDASAKGELMQQLQYQHFVGPTALTSCYTSTSNTPCACLLRCFLHSMLRPQGPHAATVTAPCNPVG